MSQRLNQGSLASESGILTTIQYYLQHSTSVGFILHVVKLQMNNGTCVLQAKRVREIPRHPTTAYANIFLQRSYVGLPAILKDKEFSALMQLCDAK